MILHKCTQERTGTGRWRRCSTAAVAFLCCAAALPGAAQQTPLPQRPADTGKPMVFDAPSRAVDNKSEPTLCPAALPCRIELVGKAEHNGAVELRATAFSW